MVFFTSCPKQSSGNAVHYQCSSCLIVMGKVVHIIGDSVLNECYSFTIFSIVWRWSASLEVSVCCVLLIRPEKNGNISVTIKLWSALTAGMPLVAGLGVAALLSSCTLSSAAQALWCDLFFSCDLALLSGHFKVSPILVCQCPTWHWSSVWHQSQP